MTPYSLVLYFAVGGPLVPYQGISQDTCDAYLRASRRPPHVIALVEYPDLERAVCRPDPWFVPRWR